MPPGQRISEQSDGRMRKGRPKKRPGKCLVFCCHGALNRTRTCTVAHVILSLNGGLEGRTLPCPLGEECLAIGGGFIFVRGRSCPPVPFGGREGADGMRTKRGPTRWRPFRNGMKPISSGYRKNKSNMLTHAHFSCDHVSKIRMRCILCGAIWSVRSP
jgi:hypothetical protein